MERYGFAVTTMMVAALAALAGCGVKVEPLMPTPILYTDVGLDPLAHIPEDERWTPRRVYYVTGRERDRDMQEISYTNTPSETISVGAVLIDFGEQNMTWSELREASTDADRDEPIELSISGVVEAGQFTRNTKPSEADRPPAAGLFLRDFNHAIEDARDKDVLIYVHGAKVNFYNACAFAAQLDHFMGRDLTPMAFCWPTRQDIFAYVTGADVARAYDAAEDLASVIEVLAAETDMRRVHILSWSAGGRVATRALSALRARYPDESLATLRDRFRIGTAYFAAGDVPTSDFLEALPDIHGISDRVVVTGSGHDEALKTASVTMGEGGRIGQTGNEISDEERTMLLSLERLELVHVSLGAKARGFDITGHRYWFNHPWASSDVVLAIRTDLLPAERGLEQGEHPILWSMPEDYPERLRATINESTLRDRQ